MNYWETNKPAKRKYHATEVAQHCDAFNGDCWVIVHNKVYDLSEYVQDHPGGPDVIAPFAGGDATALFEDARHSRDARDYMERMCIGQLEDIPPKGEWGVGPNFLEDNTIFSTTLRLVGKELLTADPKTPTYLFKFQMPSGFKFVLPSGMHIFLQAKLPSDIIVRRAYTPSHVENDIIELVIKIYPGGRMTSWLDKMKIGDPIDMNGPKGKYYYRPNAFRRIGMVAGGTGLAPMLRVIDSVVSNESDKTRINLMFANPDETNIILRDKLENLAQQHSDKFSLFLTVDNPQAGWKGGRGLIDKPMLKQNLPPPADGTLILMSGPPQMIKHTTTHLRDLGYTEDMLFSRL